MAQRRLPLASEDGEPSANSAALINGSGSARLRQAARIGNSVPGPF